MKINMSTLTILIVGGTKTGQYKANMRKGCMAVVIENTIVVLRGQNERMKDLKSVEGFSFDRYTWEELPDMKESRCFATAVVT